MKITPLPLEIGIGFSSYNPIPEDLAVDYKQEKVGRFFNYYFTPKNWKLPKLESRVGNYLIDGFSPNLNKKLHIGHLRNLALANSLKRILDSDAKFVALLGASLGVIVHALDDWDYWTEFLDYKPEVYYDVVQPLDLVEVRKENDAELWDGPMGPVIVRRSDGRPLYSFYDLAFSKRVGPTHYITGKEQKEHFQKLGFGDKHLPMGLILGEDNKKMKSRNGDAFLACDAMDEVKKMLNKDSNELAWNVLCWNFLQANREKDIQFQAKKWIKPEAPGMYISYTFARITSALQSSPMPCFHDIESLSELELKLLGVAEYMSFYYNESINRLDPSPIANFAYQLAKTIGNAYTQQRVRGGELNFKIAMSHAAYKLGLCMELLGMFLLEEV